MTNKLKPCPFCGNTDIHITQSYPHYVYCLDCGMMVQLAGKAYVKDIPEIIKIWNMRVPPGKANVLLGVLADYKLMDIKSEVIKDFAERFENELGEEFISDHPYVASALDNIVEDMIGVIENGKKKD